MHLFDGFWFTVVRTDMHGLHAQSLCVFEKLCFACIKFLFAFDLSFCPLGHVFSDEIWYANHRDKTKLIFSLWVIAAHALLPPQALQRRNNEIEVTFLPHFYRVHNRIQQTDRALILATFVVRVAGAAHCYEIHWLYIDNVRLLRWRVQFFVLFLEVEGHVRGLSVLLPISGRVSTLVHMFISIWFTLDG